MPLVLPKCYCSFLQGCPWGRLEGSHINPRQIEQSRQWRTMREKSAGFAISLLGVKLFIKPSWEAIFTYRYNFTSKIVQNNSKQIWLLWIMDSYFDKKCQLRVLNIIKMDLLLKTWNVWLLKTLTDGLEWYGLFLSAVWTHSDGTHSLQSIHLWASKGMTHFSKSDEETNSSTSRITWGEDIFSKSSFLAELFKAGTFFISWMVPCPAGMNSEQVLNSGFL